MTKKSSLLSALVASALLAVTIAALDVGSAMAGAAPPVDATGSVACTGAAGLAKFSPALSSSGTATSDGATFKVNLNGCSASGTTNVTSPNFTGHASGTLTASSNSCATLAGSQAVTGTLTIRWTGKAGTAKLNNTVVTMTSLTGVVTGANGNPGFTFSSQSASGSFAGSVSGELDSAQTALALGMKCAGPHGLSKITVNAGSVSQP
jgi:hypothetical protein